MVTRSAIPGERVTVFLWLGLTLVSVGITGLLALEILDLRRSARFLERATLEVRHAIELREAEEEYLSCIGETMEGCTCDIAWRSVDVMEEAEERCRVGNDHLKRELGDCYDQCPLEGNR